MNRFARSAASVPTIVAVGLFLATNTSVSPNTGTVATLGFILLLPDSDILDILVWIGAGCVVLGGVGWGVVTLIFPEFSPLIGLGAGVAVGGGFGAVAHLLADSEPDDHSETMTVDMEAAETAEPTPADLFEASPDPLLFYTVSGDGPVVRAVNPAFEETFGVTGTALDGATLQEGVLAADAGEIVAAARVGEEFDGMYRCETAEEKRELRVRVVPVAPTRGYILYTELGRED